MIRSFLLRLAVLLAPFAVVLAFPFFVMWRAGEFMPLEEVASIQKSSGATLYGVAYNNGWRRLKSVAVGVRRPAVVALGTSRVMQLREGFFRRPADFYNAGGATYDLSHLNDFLNDIGESRENQPRILIIGLDQNFFNEKWHYPPELVATYGSNRFLTLAKGFQQNWKLVYSDYLHGKISLAKIASESGEKRRVGLSAMMDGGAFRSDGSFFYIRDVTAALNGQLPTRVRFAPQLSAIELGRDQFTWSESVSPVSIETLEAFLDRCHARGIHVVGFLPPYPHAVYARMHGSPHYRYLDRLGPQLAPLFARRGYTFEDLSDLATVGGTDDETIDGFHASERAYLRVLIHLAEKDEALRREVDPARLRTLLAQAKNPFETY